MKRILRSAVSLLLCAAVALGGTACGRSKLPTTITIWTYYNGDQLECFNQLVEQFNSTVGKEKNIRVESSSQGSVNDLETSVLAAAEGRWVPRSCPTSSPPTRTPPLRWIRWALPLT